MRDGRPVSAGHVREGMELSIFHVPKSRIPLSSSVSDPSVYPVVEAALGIDLASYALDAGNDRGETHVRRDVGQHAALQRVASRSAAAHARERARGRRRSRTPRRLRRARPRGAQLARARCDRRCAQGARGRRNADRAIGQADRHFAHARARAGRHHGELQRRRTVGDAGDVLRPREERPHLLGRAYRRRLAVHRFAGRHSRHLRDLLTHRGPPFQRRSARPFHPHRRTRRDGRRATAGRHARERGHAGGGSRSGAHRPADRDRLPRSIAPIRSMPRSH